MDAQKQTVDLRLNSRKQQQSQHDAMEMNYHLVDEESEVGIEEEQTHGDVAMVNVDAEHKVEATDDDESDGIPSDVGELDEWTSLDLHLLYKDLMCPICLGILKKTKTFNDCLHRFCGRCINKAMSLRKGCPSCGRNYGTNRVLRSDPDMDSIIDVVIGDINKFEKEMEDSAREQLHQQQPVTVTGGLSNIGNTSAGTSAKWLSNRRKRTRKPTTQKRSANRCNENEHGPVIQNEHQQDQVNQNEINRNEGDENRKDDEVMAEIMPLKFKRLSQDSSTNSDLDYGKRNTSGGVVLNTEIPSDVAASHRSSSGARRMRNTRLTRLAKHLHLGGQKIKKNDLFEIHVKLVSLNTNIVGDLEKPHLFCSPTMSFHHLREYVARETQSRARDIQLFVVEGANPHPNQTALYQKVGYPNIDLLPQEDSHTLAQCPTKNGKLIIAYGLKNIS